MTSMKGCRVSGEVAEPSPEFFEFTPDDYHKVMAGKQHNPPSCNPHVLHVRGLCVSCTRLATAMQLAAI